MQLDNAGTEESLPLLRQTAPPLSLELAIVAGLVLCGLVFRYGMPFLTEHVTGARLANCEAPASAEIRVILVSSNGKTVSADCGPLVASRGAAKAAK